MAAKSKIGMITCDCKMIYPRTSFCYCFLVWKIYSVKLVYSHNSISTSKEHPLMIICNCSSSTSICCPSKMLKVIKLVWSLIIFVNEGCTSKVLNDQQPLPISSNVHCFQMICCIGYGLVMLKVSSIVFVYIKSLIISDKSQDIIITRNITTIWRIVGGSGKRL